jgi:carboxypeptidase C (cathepsin A)
MHLRRALPVFLAVISLLSTSLAAEEKQGKSPQQTAETNIFSLLPTDSVTEHVLKTPGRSLPYTATAGTLALYGLDGQISAKVFYTAYIAKDRSRKRPLTFAFNGGPGASSAYLHLGLVGPKVLDFGPKDNDGTTPVLKDNPESWLDFTDLVLIDPVGTGWSRPYSDQTATRYYGVQQDAESLAKVIALYVNHNGRTEAPKYLLGESYGGFRAAKVASALKSSQGILVSGVVMVSPMIDASFIFGSDDDPLTAALQLPSLVAADLDRKKTFSEAAIAEAEHFAMTDYLVALAGPPLTGARAEAFYGRVAALTGISEGAVARTRGFLGDLYAKETKAKAGEIVSPYDAAYAAPDAYPESAINHSDDPILDGFTRAYGAAFASYAREDLKYPCDMTYTLLSKEVNRQWDWNGGRTKADATDDIRDLLSTIPAFRLAVIHGYSDAITPFGASRYVLDHLPPTLAAGRTELKLYPGGHMFYTRDDSRRRVSDDMRKFFSAGTE